MTDQQRHTVRHTVVRAFPGFDVRRYPDSVVARVRIDGDVARAAHHGVRALQRLLAQRFLVQRRLEATTPVLLEQAGESRYLVSVVLADVLGSAVAPAEYEPQLGEPQFGEPQIGELQVSEVPGHEAAVLRFTGGVRAQRFTERGRELLTIVHAGGLEPVSAVYFARFFPVWTPGFLTRNEALVRVTSA